jgi:hypothetical protein
LEVGLERRWEAETGRGALLKERAKHVEEGGRDRGKGDARDMADFESIDHARGELYPEEFDEDEEGQKPVRGGADEPLHFYRVRTVYPWFCWARDRIVRNIGMICGCSVAESRRKENRVNIVGLGDVTES